MPGHPSGKVEKSFCSLYLLGYENVPALRLSLMSRDWTPRSSVFSPTLLKLWLPGERFSEMNDAATQPDGNCLRPVACPQLFHDVLDVSFDGFLGDKKKLGDIAVTVAAGDRL